MARRMTKAKEPVTIRYKEIKGGNQSVYFDIYENGKRRYFFPKLYLIPERTPLDKAQNKETMRAVNALKSKMVIDITNEKGYVKKKTNISLGFCIDRVIERKNTTDGTSKKYNEVKNRLNEFDDVDNLPLSKIDVEWCKSFVQFIESRKTSLGKLYSANNRAKIVSSLKFFLNYAVRNEWMSENPMNKLQPDSLPKFKNGQRQYLTIEELDMLENSTYDEEFKHPFLFSCYTGLRYSDISKLRWDEIKTNNGKKYIEIVQGKTDELVCVPLTERAMKHLPDRENSDPIFVFDVPLPTRFEKHLKQWMESVGIEKHITFHCARHTFATTLLSLGADLYTTSKLLGHTNISTTQIYAKIVDKKKEETMALLDNM